MEENGRDKGADCSKNKEKHEENLRNGKPRNFLRNLMYRDFGIGTTNKASTRELEPVAETILVRKDHKELKCSLPGVPRATFLMVFSPDGTKVASTHGNHFIYVTDFTTGKNVKTLSGHPRTPWCIAFHPWSNDILASGCLGGQVRVWDLSGGSEVWNAESETGIASLAFHPSERLLVIATYNEIHFWDWSEPSPFAVATTRNTKEKVRYVAFDKSGQKLITGIGNTPDIFQSQWDIGPRDATGTSQIRRVRDDVIRANVVPRNRIVPAPNSSNSMSFDTTEDDTDKDYYNNIRRLIEVIPQSVRYLIQRNYDHRRRTPNENDDDGSRQRANFRNPENASRTARSPIPQTGSVTIEVRRNRHAVPSESEVNDGNRQVDDALPSVSISPTEIDTSSEGEPPPLEPVSDTESSEVETRGTVAATRASSEPTIDTPTQSSTVHLERPEPLVRAPKPATAWPRRRNENRAPPAAASPTPSSYPRANLSNVGILAAIWPRTQGEPPAPPPPVPVRALPPGLPMHPFLTPLSNSTSQSTASTSAGPSTIIASTASTSSDASAAPLQSHERLEIERALELLFDKPAHGKQRYGECAKHTKQRKPACTTNPGKPSTNDTNEGPRRQETTTAMAAAGTSSAISDDQGPNGPSSERKNGGDASRTERRDASWKSRSRDGSDNDTGTDRTTDDGETSSSSEEAQATSQQRVPQQRSAENSGSQRLSSTSGFTVSSRSAFQPSQPRPDGILSRLFPSNSSNRPRDDQAASIAGENADENDEAYVPRSGLPLLFRRMETLADSVAFNHYENNNNVSSGNNNNNTDEDNGEESGYWLLEENSNSDSNHENVTEAPGASTSATSSNWTSRWIPVECTQTNIRPSGTTNENSARRTERATGGARITTAADVDSITDRNQLSPVIVNSTRYEQPPLFPFSRLRENQAKKREEENRRRSAARENPEEVRTNEARAATSSASISSIPASESSNNHPSEDSELSRPSSSMASSAATESPSYLDFTALESSVDPENVPLLHRAISCIPVLVRHVHMRALSRRQTGEATNSRSSLAHSEEPEEPAGSRATGSSVETTARLDDMGFRGWTPPRVPGPFPTWGQQFYKCWRGRWLTACREMARLSQAKIMWGHLHSHIYSLLIGCEWNEENRLRPASTAANPVRCSPARTSNRNLTSTESVQMNPEVKQSWAEFQNVLRGLTANLGRQRSNEENQPSTSAASSSLIPDDAPSTSSGTITEAEKRKKLWSEIKDLLRSLGFVDKPEDATNSPMESSNAPENNVSPVDNEQPSTSRSSIGADRLDAAGDATENDPRASASRKKENPEDANERENLPTRPAKSARLETNDDSREDESRDDENLAAESSTNECKRLLASIPRTDPPPPFHDSPSVAAWTSIFLEISQTDANRRQASSSLLANLDDATTDAEDTAGASNAARLPSNNDGMASGLELDAVDRQNNVNSNDHRSADNPHDGNPLRRQGAIKRRFESDGNEASSSRSTSTTSPPPSDCFNTAIGTLQRLVSENKTSMWKFSMRRPTFASDAEYRRLTEIPRYLARSQLYTIVQHLTRFFEKNKPRNGSNSNIPNRQLMQIIRMLSLARALTVLLHTQWLWSLRHLESFRPDLRVRNDNDAESGDSSVRESETSRRATPSNESVQTHIRFSPIRTTFANRNENNVGNSNPRLTFAESIVSPVRELARPRDNSFTFNLDVVRALGGLHHARRFNIPEPPPRDASNIDNARSQARERTGINVPAVHVNNVPVNFINVPRVSPTYRFRNLADRVEEVSPPIFNARRFRSSNDLRAMLLANTESRRRLYGQHMIRRTLLRAAQNLYVGYGASRGTGGGGGQDPGNDSDDIESRDYPSRPCEDVTSYRVQAWDFTHADIPDVSNPHENLVVRACQIHNDASIDISSDGKLLVTVLPPLGIGQPATVAVYSLQWESLGERLHSANVNTSVVSVSLSPTREHLLVGMALRRPHGLSRLLPMALIYKLVNPTSDEKETLRTKATRRRIPIYIPYERAGRHLIMPNGDVVNIRMRLQRENDEEPYGQDQDEEDEEDDENDGRERANENWWRNRNVRADSDLKDGRGMRLVRELVLSSDNTVGYIILNCIRWAPQPGQGMVYATNTGQLNILH